MKKLIKFILIILFLNPLVLNVQAEDTSFDQASASIQQRLEQSVTQLNQLRDQIAKEKVPLSRKLSDLESELAEIRLEYQQATRMLDSRTLDLSNLRSEIKSRKEEATYLSNLLGEYIRNFESRLHIAEIQRYRQPLETAKLAPENSNLSDSEIFQAQASLLSVSLDHLEQVLGGATFKGSAVDSSGLVKQGTFIMFGPVALFQSEDGQVIGTVEQRLGSLEPSVVPFANQENTLAAIEVFENSHGLVPIDPSLGNAHKIQETKETFLEHIQKGGVVMYPIFTLAGLAMIVAVFKWFSMLLVRKPSQKKIRQLLTAVSEHDQEKAQQKAKAVGGVVGSMLAIGVEHIRQPRELIEEVMYEKIMSTKLKLQRFLPFIAVCAASAPLLGLLGTVTGIINTFKLITVFGSGDVKTLSGGISEALITTEFGLIVAIPSLLIHALLSRKAKNIVDQMEKAAFALVNQVAKTPFNENNNQSENLSSQQMQQLLNMINSQQQQGGSAKPISYPSDKAGGMMSSKVVSVGKKATVADAINTIRAVGLDDDIDTIFVVDDDGKYLGHIKTPQLLTKPDQTPLETVASKEPVYVRVDADKNQIHNQLSKHDLKNVPVLDYHDQLVGQINRKTNGDGK